MKPHYTGPKRPICWLCNGFLEWRNGKPIFSTVELPNGIGVKVHKACVDDTKALIEPTVQERDEQAANR